MAYQPGIPTGTVNLNVDYQNIQENFQQLDTQFGVDHVPFSNTGGIPPNGYHTNVHLNPFSTTVTNAPNNFIPSVAIPQGVPTSSPGYGQLFSCQVNDGYAVDQSLYWLSGGGRLFTLLRNISPVANANGYTCIPGGFIMIWGIVNISLAPAIVNFNSVSGKSFTNACFNVSLTMISKPAGPPTPPPPSSSFEISIQSGTVSTTGFTAIPSGNQAGYQSFYFLAIGN